MLRARRARKNLKLRLIVEALLEDAITGDAIPTVLAFGLDCRDKSGRIDVVVGAPPLISEDEVVSSVTLRVWLGLYEEVLLSGL